MEVDCLKVIKCDQGAVRAVRFNVDGSYCLTCGSDKKLKLWNPYKALYLKTYGGHAGEVTDACGSCDSSHIVSSGADKTVILWDVATGQIVRRFRGHAGKVTCVRYNEESTVAVSGSNDNTVICWDMKSRKMEPIQMLKDAKDCVTSIQVTDHEILVGSLDSYIRCYDIRQGQMVRDYIGDPIIGASLTQDSQCILASSSDLIRLMDKETGELLSEYKGHTTKDYVVESCVDAKDKFVLSGSTDGNVYCWELISSTVTRTYPHSGDRTVHSICPHPSRCCFLAASGGSVYVWGTADMEAEAAQNETTVE